MCTWLSSPCRGASLAGWQFLQRGESKTVQARRKAARDVSAFEDCADNDAKVSASTKALSLCDCRDHASEVADNATTAAPAIRKTERFGLICSDILVLETIVWRISVYAERKSSALIGNRRMGFPVRAKIALATAGATGGTPGSPTPVGFSVLSTMYTSISGASNMRNIG